MLQASGDNVPTVPSALPSTSVPLSPAAPSSATAPLVSSSPPVSGDYVPTGPVAAEPSGAAADGGEAAAPWSTWLAELRDRIDATELLLVSEVQEREDAATEVAVAQVELAKVNDLEVTFGDVERAAQVAPFRTAHVNALKKDDFLKKHDAH